MSDDLMTLLGQVQLDPQKVEKAARALEAIDQNPETLDQLLNDLSDSMPPELLAKLRATPEKASHFRNWMRSAHPDLTEEDLDALEDEY